MKIIRMQTQGFQRVVAVDITPPPGVVDVRGDNAEGKSSLLDSIRAAIGGANEAPLKPVRSGEEFAAIRIELGDGKPDLIVTKYFDEVGEKLRVETADGATFDAGQTKLSALLGRMTFDPLAFSKLKPAEQAAELRRLVPLPVDLDALAKADAADVVARRDTNRDAKAVKARIDAIPVPAELPERPDREALADQMAKAADTNSAIERERSRRSYSQTAIGMDRANWQRKVDRVKSLREEADRLEVEAAETDRALNARTAELEALRPLDEPVDVADLRQKLAHADIALGVLAKADERAGLVRDFDALKAKYDGFQASIAERATVRAKALAEAVMPVEGLSIARTCDVVPGNDSEELIAVYQGEPFAQASSAQQLRVSMQLAMAANPKLRVMLIKDGSLLDSKGFELIRELASKGDYQVWVESVGEGDGTGFIMEAGKVRGAPDPEPLDGPKRRKVKPAEGVVDLPAAGDIKAGEAVKLNDEGKVEAIKPEPAPAAPERPRRPRPAPLGSIGGGLFGDEK